MRSKQKIGSKFAIAILTVFLAAAMVLNFYQLIAFFIGTTNNTGDKIRDANFDEAIVQISIDKYKGNGLYDTDLSSYFEKVRLGLSDKDYENYIGKRVGLIKGPTISKYLGYPLAYQLSASISGITLKSYSSSFSINEKLVFGFTFSDSNQSTLIKSGTYLVYTGSI